jgi:hypothetical protein
MRPALLVHYFGPSAFQEGADFAMPGIAAIETTACSDNSLGAA